MVLDAVATEEMSQKQQLTLIKDILMLEKMVE